MNPDRVAPPPPIGPPGPNVNRYSILRRLYRMGRLERGTQQGSGFGRVA